jgi:hypothetical protein
MPKSIEAFVGQRAKLLGEVVLTRSKDIQVVPFPPGSSAGVDLIAFIAGEHPDLLATPYFGVEVQGTAQSLKDAKAASRFASHTMQGVSETQILFAPVILMVFSMEGDRGYWGWVMQPSVDGLNSPSLSRSEQMHM